MDWKITSQQGMEKNVRMDRERTVKLNSHLKVGQDDQPADTILNMMAMGSRSDGLDPGVPSYGGVSAVPVLAISGPIFMDTNGNNKWDPPNFRDKGK